MDNKLSVEEIATENAWQIPSAEIIELSPRRSLYAVCIPVIDEGERLKKQLAEMKTRSVDKQVDILILDGGSTDGSTDREFLSSQGVRTLLVKTGPGRVGAQLRMGYAYALIQGYKGVITIDGNNKDGVEAIPDFVRELENGYDFVQGSRYVPGGQAINTPWSRYLATKWIHVPLISLAAGFRYTDTTNGFRGYSRRLLLNPGVQPFRNIFGGYELLFYLSVRAPRTGHRVKEIPVVRRYPVQGQIPSKISPIKGNWNHILMLMKVLLGKCNPQKRSERYLK
jgi:glycosyltransferase involved in cell wall biosynthesis